MKRLSLVVLTVLLLSVGPVRSLCVAPATFCGFVHGLVVVSRVERAVVKAWTLDALDTTVIGWTNWHGYYEGNGELPPDWFWLQATCKSQKSRIECAYYDGANPVRVDFYFEE